MKINGGTSPYFFSDLYVADGAAASVKCVRKDPRSTSTVVYASTTAGLFANQDGTLRSWAPVGPPGVSTKGASFSVAVNGDLILGAAGIGYRKPASPPTSGWSTMLPPIAGQLFDTLYSSIVEFPSGRLLAYNGYDQKTYRSSDFGNTAGGWTPVSGAPRNFAWEARAGTNVYGPDPASFANLLVSTDEGSTWAQSISTPNSRIDYLRFDGTNAWGTRDRTLTHSPLGAVGAAQWIVGATLAAPFDFIFDVADPTRMLVMNNSTLVRSTDGGLTFQQPGTGVSGDTYGDFACSRLFLQGALEAVATNGHGLWVGSVP